MPKCGSLVIQASTGKRIFVDLTISGQTFPPAEVDSFKFLGMTVCVNKNNKSARVSIQGNLQRMIEAIDTASLTRQQKLRLFRFGVCPRLSWPLIIEEFPISWLERELQPMATRALKKWSGLASSSNTSFLFLPPKQRWSCTSLSGEPLQENAGHPDGAALHIKRSGCDEGSGAPSGGGGRV